MSNKRSKVFYGWWIVVAGFLITLYTGGTIMYGFTAIFEPIVNEFGWSYAQISLAASLRGLEIGLFAPFFGMLVDRWGPRRLLFGGGIITTLGLVLLSRVTSLGMFYGAFILVALGLSATSSTVLVTAVANWFRRKLGVATGIMDCGVAFGGLLIPLMVILIDLYEWRTTMLILGLGMLAVVLPLALVARHKPEQYGYLPDGELGSSAITEEGLTLAQTAEEGVGAMQALKSGAFWRIALALACFSMMGITLSTHVMPYLNSMGISRVTSGLVASAIPLVSIGGRLSFGWFGDKFDKRWISASAFAMMGLGLLCFEYASTAGVWALVPFLVLFGTGMGGIHPMRATLLRDYFGRSKFGTIFGFATGVMMIGNIAGAPLAGWVFDNWGSYQGVWSALACLAIISIALITTTPRPQSG